MNLALAHCWKEWRAQRVMIVSYVLLVTASLCLGFSFIPEQWWKDAVWSRHALSWFLAAGVIGVVAFVAPGLVRCEFGPKDDQFVRRLPGALGVSFAGKLLFALLAACALALLLVAAGEAFLVVIGQSWLGVFDVIPDGEVRFVEPWPWELARYALLLAPFVWAIATWLPNGRMAIGGTAVFVLFVGMFVTAVLRQSPEIERGLQWRPWLWAVPVAGLVTVFASWVKGRLGGGALRSAKFGLAAFAVCALPPSLWLGNEVARYHHPDPQRLVELHVTGITKDRRFVLATGNENEHWCGMPFRIDLATGEATQIGGMGTLFTPHVDGSNSRQWQSVRRFWGVVDEGRWPTRAFDLASGTFTEIPRDATTGAFRLPVALDGPCADEARASSTLRGPDGERVWLWNDQLCVEDANGRLSRRPFGAAGAVRAAGHGFRLYDGRPRWFDFRGEELVIHGTRELDALCMALLAIDPRARPNGREVLARLGAGEAGEIALTSTSSAHQPPFVGRRRELELLDAAFEDAQAGAPVAVLVEGESGVGKSALVRRFLDALAATERGVIVLAGRCYERESVPYKAFDGVVDALSRYLLRLDDASIEALLPRQAGLVAQVFPVLRQLKAFTLAEATDARPDPQGLRAQLFAAIRELLGRLSARGPLVLTIDDMQWADQDSRALLAEVLRAPDAPPLLLIATVRPEGADTAATIDPGRIRRVQVAPLEADEAQALARQLLARSTVSPSRAADIAREANGHPLFIDELVRFARSGGAPGEHATGLRLDEALVTRVGALPADARRLIEVAAVAGGPLRQTSAARAASLGPAEFAAALAMLRAERLIRTSGVRGADTVEPYHDRIREAVTDQLPGDTRRGHQHALAVALEGSDYPPDPEVLAGHWLGAGETERAATWTVRARLDATPPNR